MKDSDIRTALYDHLIKINGKYSDTVIIDELDLCSGMSRIDVAVINGSIHGYEIKSEEDTLNRLPSQIYYYNKSLEKVTIATNMSHLDRVIQEIPEWWGIIIVKNNGSKNTLKLLRKADNNPAPEKRSLLQLLWKDELISITEKYNITSKKSFIKRLLQERISLNLDISRISQEVRAALKSRQNWRS